MAFIEVDHVTKEFKVHEVKSGLEFITKSMLHRKYNIKRAVDDMSFCVNQGEIVGYIGPNGAGKSTTIKMLSGILYPTSGELRVNGRIPYKDKKQNAKHIGVVFGQRSQLFWDLPFVDTLGLYKRMYDIPDQAFQKNCEYYIGLFDMKDFIRQPVRQLSLGQKMKANIMISLIHEPEVLYLDEPTIGLDVMTKASLRKCIRQINEERNTTIMLTTHDMDDIEAICSRLILIDHGRKLFDGTLSDFKQNYAPWIEFRLEFKDQLPVWLENKEYEMIAQENNNWRIRYTGDINNSTESCKWLIDKYSPSNIRIGEPSIDSVIEEYYREREKNKKDAGYIL